MLRLPLSFHERNAEAPALPQVAGGVGGAPRKKSSDLRAFGVPRVFEIDSTVPLPDAVPLGLNGSVDSDDESRPASRPEDADGEAAPAAKDEAAPEEEKEEEVEQAPAEVQGEDPMPAAEAREPAPIEAAASEGPEAPTPSRLWWFVVCGVGAIILANVAIVATVRMSQRCLWLRWSRSWACFPRRRGCSGRVASGLTTIGFSADRCSRAPSWRWPWFRCSTAFNSSFETVTRPPRNSRQNATVQRRAASASATYGSKC